MKRLWEVDHPYYCNEGNYYASESVGDHFQRWQDFIAEYHDADFDMNLVFRFDWDDSDSNSGTTYTGDDYYRNGLLKIFWMGQRKGLYRYSTVDVCRADEPAIIEFLRPRFEHMLTLWEPFSMSALQVSKPEK